MRPQHITAENRRLGLLHGAPSAGFNEAAAYHCGKRRTVCRGPSPSMGCFNEAAAYHCGKQVEGVKGFLTNLLQ